MRILMHLTLFERVWSDPASLIRVPVGIVLLGFQRLLGIQGSNRTLYPFVIDCLVEVPVH
jgi:hypothetical protein